MKKIIERAKEMYPEDFEYYRRAHNMSDEEIFRDYIGGERTVNAITQLLFVETVDRFAGLVERLERKLV